VVLCKQPVERARLFAGPEAAQAQSLKP
jgi:hypothetical protein